jgi:hypothetical protein
MVKMYLPPPGAKDTRRGFLQKGLIGGAILALGGGAWLSTRRSAELPEPKDGLQVLSPREFALISALCLRFVPVREGFPAVERVQTAVAVDRILTMVDETARQELKQLMLLFENALPAFLFGGRTTPFTQLTPGEQETVLGEWQKSRLTVRRSGYLALRGLIMAAYYGNKETWSAVNYPGPLPGVFEPNAPVWKGDGPRPPGNGVWVEPPPEPAPTPDAPVEPEAPHP